MRWLNKNLTKWTTVGNVEERNEESWKICNRNKTYRVAIPAKMSWNEAIQVCIKLGGGNMTEKHNKEDIHYTISLFENLNSSCNYIWLPLQDEDVEGQFQSAVTGQLVDYLPWDANQPDGAEEANYMAIQMVSKAYHDKIGNDLLCTSCDLHKTLEFSLLGVCKDTYLGKSVSLNQTCIIVISRC